MFYYIYFISGSMALPPKCYGGTCDGCTYQIRWRTKLACPKCDDSHYERIVGQCEGGQQTVRYMPDKYVLHFIVCVRGRQLLVCVGKP